MEGGATVDTEVPAEADPTRPENTVAVTYRPHWDGLRAVAVYLVVAYHAGSRHLSGGFVGVDVFFVLSGYLVTQLLLRDIVGTGAIRFSRFYARRFRRLLPAAFVALLASAAVWTVIASPSELSGVTDAFRAAFLYSTNWYFIHNSAGYFGPGVATNPVLHFWSLAVEEQFYLVWPLALGGLFALTRRFGDRQRRVVRIVVAVVLVGSLARALSLRTSNPDWAYYGSDARAYQLLAGASIALIPNFTFAKRYGRRAWRAVTALSLLLLLLLATSWIHFDAIERGISVAATVTILIVAIESTEGGLVKRALSTPPIVYLGKISYGTYLWHWIVILVLAKQFSLGTTATIVVAAVVATALASLSYQMLEQPIRAPGVLDRFRVPVVALGLAISVVSALVIVPAIIDRGGSSPTTLQGSTIGFTPVPKGINWQGIYQTALKDGGPFTTCEGKAVSVCTLVHGTGTHILLMGDSHAWMLIPTFEAIARRDNLTLSVSVRAECPWQLGLYLAPVTGNGSTTSPNACKSQKQDTYRRVVPQLRPDLVIVTQASYERSFQHWLGDDGKPRKVNEAVLEAASRTSLAQLSAGGRKVLVIEPTPQSTTDPLTCLSHAKVVDECRTIAPARPSPLELYYRKLDGSMPGVSDIDIDRLVCPFMPICDPIIAGQIVKWDASHLTVGFATSLAPAIEADLKQRRLIRG